MGSAEDGASGFTAVNGKDAHGERPATTRRPSDERTNGQPRISPPGQEKLTITTTTTQRESWIPSANSVRPPYHHGTTQDTESHKRKRSGSVDPNTSSANSYHSHAMPASAKETPTTATTTTTEYDVYRDDNKRSHDQGYQHDSHNSDPQHRHYLPSAEESRQPTGHDQWGPRQYHQSSYNLPDEQLGEVLQRASQNIEERHHEYASPGDDEQPYTPYDNDRRELSAQSDPKKRKRNFSNRTKTGCMTCRRRKKKCDETRPECECSSSHLRA